MNYTSQEIEKNLDLEVKAYEERPLNTTITIFFQILSIALRLLKNLEDYEDILKLRVWSLNDTLVHIFYL